MSSSNNAAGNSTTKVSTNSTGNSGSSATNRQNRFHSPPVELPSSNAQNFFEEAKITAAEENELRRKFGKFCTKVSDGEEDAYLTLDDFCRMLQYYECTSAQHYEAYFHAIDRNHDDRLTFQEFFLGCCAADPSTVHILNSFTGYERSQYIFDFYDTNRSSTLEFDEFARLTADCLSLPTANPNDEQVKRQAIEKARDFGALEESKALLHFTCIKFKKFYEFIQNERLRGTSRLFRFYKSIIKSRGGHGRRTASSAQGNHANSGSAMAGGSSPMGTSGGTTPVNAPSGHGHSQSHAHEDDEEPLSEREDCEWHAHLLDIDAQFDPDGNENVGMEANEILKAAGAPYISLPPAAPPLRNDFDPSLAQDARSTARKILRSLCAQSADPALIGTSAASSGAQFALASVAQLQLIFAAAARIMESEDMVLTGLQPPVKIFGSLHGQLSDLLSHFKWQQAPVEEGDILYVTYLFLGDYVDRGGYSLEVLTLLLCLKVVHPHRVALLRGLHENRHFNYHLGFRQECERRLGMDGLKIFELANRVFECLSLAAVVGGQIAALGPGVLPPSLTRLDQLRHFKKPLSLPHVAQPRPASAHDRSSEQLLLELFTPGALMPKDMGAFREATPEQVKLFCSQHQLAAVVRSRHIPDRGFSFECNGKLITLTSCTNYCDAPGGNDAAILCVTKEEGTTSIAVRPKVLTAQVAKVYRVMARVRDLGAERSTSAPPPPRWPQQVRDVTPGRRKSGQVRVGTDAASDVAGLLVHSDHTVSPDSELSMSKLAAYPAFGPGRPPADLVPNVALVAAAATAMANQNRHRGQGGEENNREQTFASSVTVSPEEWSHLVVQGVTNAGSRAASGSLPDRQSLGARRGNKGQDINLRSEEPDQGGGPPEGRTGSGSTASGCAGAPPLPKTGSTNAARPPTTSSGGAPVSGSGRDSKSTAPSTGRNTPQSGGVACQDRRNSNVGKAKDEPKARGPSRPPGVAPSPKASTVAGGARGTRRPSGVDNRGDTASGGGADAGDGLVTELQNLMQLLNVSSRGLGVCGLPPAPAPFLRLSRASEQPLVQHLCRQWVDASLSDKQWEEALQMFETELCDTQLRVLPKGGGSEDRWSLETFSMWLMKRGRRLHECSQWFHAFDFDQDEMVGVADFLQGLVSTSCPGSPLPGPASLSTALFLFRLLDLEGNHGSQKLESILKEQASEAQVAQLMQQASDFNFFRTSLMPLLGGDSTLRLQVFSGE